MRYASLLLALPGMMLAATPAAAYIGPGAGIGALGAFVGVIAAVFVSLFVIVLWPLRKVLRRMRKPVISGPDDADGSVA